MEETQKSPKSMTGHAFTQFDLTKSLLQNLNKFEISPIAKLVLLELSTCYNPKRKHIFPKQKTLALKIGCSERSIVRAIQELFKAGLILVECKTTNRYVFSQLCLSSLGISAKNFGLDNLSDDDDNISLAPDNLSVPSIHEQTKEGTTQQEAVAINPIFSNDFSPKQAQNVREKAVAKNSNLLSKFDNCCQNLSTIDKKFDEILLKHVRTLKGIKNDNAYMNWLKRTGQATQIVNDIVESERSAQIMKRKIKKLTQQCKIDAENATAEAPQIWKDFKKRLQ